jgi:DNA mismatch repair protein MutH
MVRARALEGRSLGEIGAALGSPVAALAGRHTKGLAGTLVERALGASAGSAAEPDFPALGVELKTIPVDGRGRVRESTFVCTIALGRIADEPWERSWLRRKLACVLWVPVDGTDAVALAERRIGHPILWRPDADEEAALRADFEALAGQIGVGAVEGLTAHEGQVLQVRPKGRDGRARTAAVGPDGELLSAVPRGFYLRASFTSALLGRSYAKLGSPTV